MAVTGDKLYVLTSADGKSGMDIFDLKNFIQERQVSLGQKGLGVETLVARDARVYGIRPYNPTTEEAAAILEFNTTNRTSKLIGTDGIQAYFEGVPAAVKPMGGDSILLANYNGFTAYDTKTGEIRDGIIMAAGNTVYPTEAVQDTLSQRTYVVYADENAETYQGAVYYGDEFTKEFDIYDLGRTPANLSAVPEFADNEAPKPASRFSMSPNSYFYEMGTSASAHTIWKSSNFTDHEGDFDIYLRGLEKYPWITQLDNLEDGDIRIEALYRGTVDKDSVITFQVEAIDRAGASTLVDATYTIKAQIVKPTVAQAIKDTTTVLGTDTLRIGLKDVFAYTGTTYGVTLAKTVSANDNAALVRDSIDTATDSLILILTPGKTGMANLAVRYTVTKEGYGEKFVETTFRLVVEDPNAISGSTVAQHFQVLANPFKDHLEIRIPEDGTVTLYDMNGRALMQKQLQAGTNIIPTGTLANGTYLLSYKGENQKVVRE